MSWDRRGVIFNRDRRRQIVDYSRLRHGLITPTDLDGLIDYHDGRFAFLELKYMTAHLSDGQKKALVRLVDRIDKSGAMAALFVATHEVHDPNRDVPADLCIVRAIYSCRSWQHVDGSPTLREAVDEFMGWGEAVPVYQPMRGFGREPGEEG